MNGGSTTFTVTLTTVLSATGFDRLILAHTSFAQANSVTFDKYNGAAALAKLANAIPMSSNSIYDFGPWFFGSTESMRGGATTSSGDIVIDEMRL